MQSYHFKALAKGSPEAPLVLTLWRARLNLGLIKVTSGRQTLLALLSELTLKLWIAF